MNRLSPIPSIGAFLAMLTATAAFGQARPPWINQAAGGMVASDSAEASAVGAAILRDGGNAFDAAVATSFALGVTRPYSTGMGGGGFMVAYVAERDEFVVLDFREVAPPSATPELYQRLSAQQADGPSPSVIGPHAVGVPGLVAGMHAINQRLGSRAWASLLAPAERLAREGFTVDENFRSACQTLIGQHHRFRAATQQGYNFLSQTFLKNHHAPAVGATLTNHTLADTLQLIADQGATAFYAGPIATAIETATAEAVPAAALANYQPLSRTPIRARFRGYEIVSMPPPSSGGICLAQTLNIMEAFREAHAAPLSPVDHMHLRVEAMKHAFADRARWLGDADYADVPVDFLTSPAYAQKLARRIELNKTSAPDAYGVTQLPDDRGTSHFCVIDAVGNVVSITETINATWGSYRVAEPYGIILNNELDDFLTVPGEPNLYGLVQGEANLIAPGKRPLSSMSPTIVLKDGRPVLTLGASGGPRIISSVLNVMLNVIDVGQPLHDAIQTVRVHHQWQPDKVFFDRAPGEPGRSALAARGHGLAQDRRTGIVQAIRVLPDGTLVGASDPRKGGAPAGVDR